MRIAINGFGRIGKSFLRALLSDAEVSRKIEVAVINVGKGDPYGAALALKYDTLMGTYPGPVTYEDGTLYVDDLAIKVISELDPEKAPWKNIDWVVEATGVFTDREGAEKHLKAGAKRVLITAPAKGEDVTIIPGVNDTVYKPEHNIVSLGSCTTNALFTMLKVVDEAFSIKHGFMTTIHAYTNSQPLLDVDPVKKDMRKGRAAALNIIPTTTGAMKLVDKVLPHLAGKLSGSAMRVPVGKVSLIDLMVVTEKECSIESANQAFQEAAKQHPKIIGYTTEPLVSTDYCGNNHSVVLDSLLTQSQNHSLQLFGWYDNEWGYSVRLKDFLVARTID